MREDSQAAGFSALPPVSVLDLSKTKTRYLMLFFATFLNFGSYFVYDNPSALQTQLQERLDIDSLEYNMFYSVYSFPNFILPLFGGYIIDAIGVRIAIVVFDSLVLAGQCVFAFGVGVKSFPIALVGRFIFGLGGESLVVCQSAIVSNWFFGKELAFAFGINLSISRLGSVVNNYSEPPMDSATGSPVFGLWMGAVMCGFSLICGLFLVFLDKRRDTLMGIKEKRKLDPSEKVRLKDIKEFGAMFWLITVNCLVVYVCVMTFNNIATKYFQTRFDFSEINSGRIISITYGVAAIGCPFLGFLIDQKGKRTQIIIVSVILGTLVHLNFMLMPDCDRCAWGPLNLVLLGISYSIYASVLWPCVSYVVPSKTIGTAFGLITSIQNIGLGGAPVIMGAIKDYTNKQHGYFYVSLFLFSMGLMGIVTAFILYFVDKTNGGVLSSSNPKEVLRLKEQQKLIGDDKAIEISTERQMTIKNDEIS